MNKIKEYWEILFIVLITNLFCIFVFSITAFADEINASDAARKLDMRMTINDNPLEYTADNV